jgi:hypothetical protein
MGRIKKLIDWNTACIKANVTQEARQPRESRMILRKKGEGSDLIIDNTYGRLERRKLEIKRLENALTGEQKKPRMRKFAHKKQVAKENKQPKQGKKK